MVAQVGDTLHLIHELPVGVGGVALLEARGGIESHDDVDLVRFELRNIESSALSAKQNRTVVIPEHHRGVPFWPVGNGVWEGVIWVISHEGTPLRCQSVVLRRPVHSVVVSFLGLRMDIIHGLVVRD